MLRLGIRLGIKLRHMVSLRLMLMRMLRLELQLGIQLGVLHLPAPTDSGGRWRDHNDTRKSAYSTFERAPHPRISGRMRVMITGVGGRSIWVGVG